MSSIDSSSSAGGVANLVQVSVLKLAMNAAQSEGAKIAQALQPPAQSGAGSGWLVDLYA